MVWKLLRQHLSVSQLTGFFLANLCGMVIVLLSVQFYKDVLPVFTQGDSFLKKDYLIINKEVSTLGSLVGCGNGQTGEAAFHGKRGSFSASPFQSVCRYGNAGHAAFYGHVF